MSARFPVICHVTEDTDTQFWYVRPLNSRRIRFATEREARNYANNLNDLLNGTWP